MALSIAIVEDNIEDQKTLITFLHQYEKENNQVFEVSLFDNGQKLISELSKDFDLVFMDILMPLENGFEVSKEIRRQHFSGQIVFVTNMVQFAIMGYEVDALAFLVKPISYFQFENIMKKAVKKISLMNSQDFIIINKSGGGNYWLKKYL